LRGRPRSRHACSGMTYQYLILTAYTGMMNGPRGEGYRLTTEVVGPLPIINHFVGRLRLDEVIAARMPANRTTGVGHAKCISLLLRNILLAREPIYGLPEWAGPFRPSLLGLTREQVITLNDDKIGRSLDRLFDADRASLATEIVVRAIRGFDLELDQIHNDSTTVTVHGEYKAATGRKKRGKETVKITFGKNKDHRSDLKQILWVLTVTADGAVPVRYEALDGNTSDSPTHIETWEAIRALAGRPDFVYVSDSKLCVKETLTHIDSRGGLFVTVLPRSRKEDRLFREHVQTHSISWEEVDRKPNPRHPHGSEDVWRMVESPIPAADGYRLVWLWNSLMAERDEEARKSMIERAILAVEQLETRLRSPRTRLRSREKVEAAAEAAIGQAARRWVGFKVREEDEAKFKQEKRGRPGPSTKFKRIVRKRFHVDWTVDEDNIIYDSRSDGMFPLLTNCRDLPLKEVLGKYKFQPRIEKRHEQLKTVYAVAPVLLKNEDRVEALLFVYFLALLVESLIEREVRQSMKRRGIKSIPLYYESRPCEAPTTDKILGVFERVEVHHLARAGTFVQTFQPELTERQRFLIELAGVPEEAYRV